MTTHNLTSGTNRRERVSFVPTAFFAEFLAGAREGHLGELFGEAGMHGIEQTVLRVDVEHPSFDEWWDPFLLGVGPAGSHVTRLDASRRARLRELCRERMSAEPFVVSAQAWATRGLS